MIILGIDPGYDRLGIAVLEKQTKGKEDVVYSDCFETSPKDALYARFVAIGTEIGRILDTFKPDGLAIETLFITKNQKTAMRVSEARGIIIYEAARRNIPIYEYGPMQIKTAVAGDGSADKNRVIKMVNLLVNIPHKPRMLDDEFDAIAVALAHSAISRAPLA